MKGSVNYSGWVPMRRGIVEHLTQRRLTHTEALTLLMLIMLADAATGSYTINVPTLMHFLPELSEDAADRALRSLQRKRYIYRKITYKSKSAYPYWVQGYIPTTGPLKARRLDLAEVFATKDTSKLRYGKPAGEGAAEGADESADEGAAEGADSNKKEEGRSNNQQEKSPIPITECPTVANDDALHLKSGTVAKDGAPDRAMANSGQLLPNLSQPPQLSGVGLTWNPYVGNYVDSQGRVIPYERSARMIRDKLGLERNGDGFFDHHVSAIISWNEGQRRISGMNERKAA